MLNYITTISLLPNRDAKLILQVLHLSQLMLFSNVTRCNVKYKIKKNIMGIFYFLMQNEKARIIKTNDYTAEKIKNM